MKKRIHLITKMAYVVVATLFITSCQDLDAPPFGDFEIDPSVVKINYPLEGAAIKVYEDPASIDIEIEVHDDHLVNEISIALNGTEIANLTDFIDPRNIIETVTYNDLVIGDYVLTVTSTDVNGTSSTAEVNFTKEPPYTPMFEGEILYMPFDGDFQEQVTGNLADQVGTPGFAGSGYASANAYKGATDSYITFPSGGLQSNEFSAAFWYKVNSSPDRAGLLVVGDDVTDRNQGFRLFREGSGTEQRIKLNVGTGGGESWNDGGVLDATSDDWVHVAFTVSQTETKIYFNGIEMNSATLSAPIDWTGVGPLTIGAGGETFSYWDHKSDISNMDELRIFNKALSQAEIQIMINSFNPYTPLFPGESFYMPFDSGYVNLVGNIAATVVGTPEITDQAYLGDGAYLGATNAYLTYPADGLLTAQFSTTFWYKVNSTPDRAGILVVGNDIPENRNQGFRLFREGSATEQR
ncbi:MAG TPA: LamG domain-containing protein, partial [Flavobacteriaceae bacterium]